VYAVSDSALFAVSGVLIDFGVLVFACMLEKVFCWTEVLRADGVGVFDESWTDERGEMIEETLDRNGQRGRSV